MSESFLNITGWSPLQQLQAFCVNPPDNICPSFGACPNPDVTGYGQQASVYITEVLFTFLLVFWPSKIRSTIYAHSILILSLHITCIIALFRGQLTQNDAIFVLVLVASPTTLYLWIWSFVAVATRRVFKGSGTERVAAVLTVLTLASEIMLVLTMYIPSKFINFSQPACFPGYGREVVTEIFWPVSFLLQLVFFWVVIGLYFGLFKILGKPSSTEDSPDVMTWIEQSMLDMVESARDDKSILVPCCLAIIQFQTWFIWMPIPGILAGCHLLISICGGLWTLFRRRRLNAEFWIFIGMAMLSAIAFALPLLAYFKNFPQLRLSSFGQFAPYASGVLVTVICTWTLWRHRSPSVSFRMAIYCGLFIVPLVALKIGEGLLSYFNYIDFGISRGYYKNLTFEEHIENLLFGVFTFANLPWMFVAWLTTSKWSKVREEQMTWMETWHATAARAHLLKFGLLIVFPNALWIAATIATNPTISESGYTIGQSFAIIVSLGNVISVVVDFHEIKTARWKEIVWAVVQSKQIRWNDDRAAAASPSSAVDSTGQQTLAMKDLHLSSSRESIRTDVRAHQYAPVQPNFH